MLRLTLDSDPWPIACPQCKWQIHAIRVGMYPVPIEADGCGGWRLHACASSLPAYLIPGPLESRPRRREGVACG